MICKWVIAMQRLCGISHDFCEVVTRMLYGNVQQIDKFYQPLFPLLDSVSDRVSEHSLMVEHHYVIVAGTGSSPAVLVYLAIIA